MAWAFWHIPPPGALLILWGSDVRETVPHLCKMLLITLTLGIVLLPKGKYLLPLLLQLAITERWTQLWTCHFVFQSQPWNAMSVWVQIPVSAKRSPAHLDNLNVALCQCYLTQVFRAWLLPITFCLFFNITMFLFPKSSCCICITGNTLSELCFPKVAKRSVSFR